MNFGGAGLFGIAQVAVARAHGQAAGLATGRYTDDFHREEQVADHAADDRQLLEILLAKAGDIRLDDMEQLAGHGGDATEMAGTA